MPKGRPATGIQLPGKEKAIVRAVIDRQEDMSIFCEDATDVRRRVLRLNRWRSSLLDVDDSLNRVMFCPRFDPPRVLVAYDHTYDMPLGDADGNPILDDDGKPLTLAALAEQQVAERHAREQAEMAEQEQSVPEEQRMSFIRRLSRETGVPVEDLMAEEGEALPAHQQAALEEAERQKGEPLTEDERRSVLQATEVPDQNADIL